ncbi:MAG TPA: glutamyl-tRNA reductase [Acidimicrobiales bacterium]|nr:glutamyl-tRNA reductase [Acidimicrobiales bacterium]
MSVVVIGLEHTQAPLPLLEAAAVGDADLHKMLSTLSHRRNIQETVVLSTCLRTEVYAVVDRFHDAVAEIYDVLSEQSGSSEEELAAHATIRFDDDVTSHLFAVTSGLESVVTGETEVVGQVRRAFERAQEEGTCGPVLSALFRHALQTGKRVRTETAISQGTTSFAYAAVTVARGDDGAGLRGARVVVVGAGDMGLGVCRALSEIAEADAPRSVVVVNRSLARAKDLVRQMSSSTCAMRAVALDDVATELAEADVILTAVAAEAHVLRVADFASVDAPLLVVDLGVPRNVDPEVGALPGVTLLDMDTLRAAVAQALGDRAEESVAARQIVATEVERYRTASRQRGAAPIIASLRARLESLRVAELERHRAQLADLSEAEWEHVDAATRAALVKFLHEPTVLLKETAGTPQGERLVEALRVLFDL